jgi:hypothetical protein
MPATTDPRILCQLRHGRARHVCAIPTLVVANPEQRPRRKGSLHSCELRWRADGPRMRVHALHAPAGRHACDQVQQRANEISSGAAAVAVPVVAPSQRGHARTTVAVHALRAARGCGSGKGLSARCARIGVAAAV